MSASAQQIIDAGGLVLPSSRAKTELPLDPVVARAYEHAVLDHPVVRLELKALTMASDLEMEVLGFEGASDKGAVAKGPRRALGFPAAAILSDPENARYALEVVKGFKKAARRAKSKPGFAKEDFDTIAETLGRSVPHYLPSFYEEASRVLLEVGNERFAGQLFEKARNAERVHALDVDEALRENTFVEFALAGALSIKSLTNYARELATREAPEDAYATFRRVCVKRTLGGLPPFGAMNAELKRLAKGAKLDVAAEERALLRELLDAPSLAQAGLSFFKPYAKALTALGKEDSAVFDRLLDLFPQAKGNEWLAYLEKVGALSQLPTWEAERRQKWLEFLLGFGTGWRQHRNGKWLQLTIDALEAIKSTGRPFSFERQRCMDLDLVELLLSNGIPIQQSNRWSSLTDLDDWARWADEPNRGCDPVHIAADPELLKLLVSEVDDELGDARFQELGLVREGFCVAIDQWLSDQLDTFGKGAMPELYASLQKLERRTSAAVWARFPERLEQLRRAEAAPAVKRTLQIGLFDELGWPAFDAALKEFHGRDDLILSGVFPHPVVGTSTRALVLGVDAAIAAFDLALPAGARATGFVYVQKRLLVCFRPKNEYVTKGLWTDRPAEVFECNGLSDGALGVLLEDGSVLKGSGRFSAGDRGIPGGDAFTDGTHHWAHNEDWPRKFLELDTSGRKGRASRPDFLEGLIREGRRLHANSCWSTVMPEGMQSPLGQVGRQVAVGLTHADRELPEPHGPAWEVTRLDGVSLNSEEANGSDVPSILIDFPGRERPLGVATGWRSLELIDGDGTVGSTLHKHYRRGARSPLNLTWWHFMRPRDAEGSAALRSVTDEQARAMVDAGRLAYESAEVKDDEKVFAFEGTPLEASITALFPRVSSPVLRRGIGGIAFMAGADRLRLDGLRTVVEEQSVDSTEKDPPALFQALQELGDIDSNSSLLADVAGLHERFMALGEGESVTWADSSGDWWTWVHQRGALAYKAMLTVTPDDQREALLEALRVFAASPVTADSSRLRVYETETSPVALTKAERRFVQRDGAVYRYGERRYRDTFAVVEWLPEGDFPADANHPPHPRSWGSTDEVDAFVARLESGAVDASDHAEAVSEASGLTLDEARIVVHGAPRSQLVKGLYDLKTKPFEFADQILRSVDSRRAVLDGAIAAGPHAAWDDPSGFAKNLVRALEKVNGGEIPPVSAETAGWLAADLREDDPNEQLRMLADSTGPVHRDATWGMDSVRNVSNTGGFDASTPREAVRVIAWLANFAPVGDPSRAHIGGAVEALRERLAHPDLRFQLGYVYEDKEIAKLIALVEGTPLKSEEGVVIENTALGDGFYIHPTRWSRVAYVHPRVRHTDPDRLTAVSAVVGAGDTWQQALSLIEGGLDGIVARVRDTPVAEGAYECNPLVSCADWLGEVASSVEVSENAAALYLQLLALPAPKDASVRRWNGWTSKTLKAAGAELVERGVVLEAKRARAGRTRFVPGGWEDLKNPFVPVETWKLSFYDGTFVEGRMQTIFSTLLPTRPVHELFRVAWDRVHSGDSPRYEEPGR